MRNVVLFVCVPRMIDSVECESTSQIDAVSRSQTTPVGNHSHYADYARRHTPPHHLTFRSAASILKSFVGGEAIVL